MSAPEIKEARTRRQHKSKSMQIKQAKIAQLHHLPAETPHHYNKHHALDCGVPRCPVCQNPRRTHKGTLTIQERRFYQEESDDNSPTSGDSANIT